MLSIDLHGLREDEATAQVMSALLSFELGHEDSMELITGKGQVLSRAVADILDEEGWAWEHDGSNYGTIIVKK